MQSAIQILDRRDVPASWGALKRAVDIGLGLLLFAIALPFIIFAVVAIVAVSRGWPFYAQERVGQYGRCFRMFKLRTMVRNAHQQRDALMHLNEADGPIFKIRNDPRLHPLGKFLRRTSIDELPNLINVLSGDMSLVGPRPALPCEVAHYDRYAERRLSVPQGITCLWQINGRSDVSFEEWMRLDNQYVDSWSPLGDIGILIRTIPVVLRRDGAH
ncbi:MAG: sugar transferase [Candidatus Eremiobacteraeota bacterium]|nr:sugar transferase [Candidatus Eremiobacteraeota bacterium]